MATETQWFNADHMHAPKFQRIQQILDMASDIEMIDTTLNVLDFDGLK